MNTPTDKELEMWADRKGKTVGTPDDMTGTKNPAIITIATSSDNEKGVS